MYTINALSLAPEVNDWLANTHHPRVLHVFDHVCNLVNECREVLSIVMPQIGNGPFNLVVQDHICFSEYLSLKSPISISVNQLQLGDLTINTAGAKLWFPRPDWKTLHGKRENILYQLTKLPITNYQKRGPDTLLAANAQGYSTTTLDPKLQVTNNQFSNSLISSIVTADIQAARASAQQLAGLGMGLTPAADDFILGAVLAAWIIHSYEVAKVLAEGPTNTAAALTTSLSAAWLRSAGRGAAGILWHQFFEALISEDKVNIQEAMDNILAVGETSGADAMAGFIGAFVCLQELTNSESD